MPGNLDDIQPTPRSFEEVMKEIQETYRDAIFTPFCFYNEDGGFYEIMWSDKPFYAEYVNTEITLLRSIENRNAIVGCQFKGVK